MRLFYLAIIVCACGPGQRAISEVGGLGQQAVRPASVAYGDGGHSSTKAYQAALSEHHASDSTWLCVCGPGPRGKGECVASDNPQHDRRVWHMGTEATVVSNPTMCWQCAMRPILPGYRSPGVQRAAQGRAHLDIKYPPSNAAPSFWLGCQTHAQPQAKCQSNLFPARP
jgi:hypothetical protein